MQIKNFFFFDKISIYNILFLMNFYNFKLMNIILIFRFSKYVNVYISIFFNFFKNNLNNISAFRRIQILKFKNNFQHIYNFFFLENFNKNDILKSAANIKRSNLFKKYNNFKRSIFYMKYADVKKIHYYKANYVSKSIFLKKKKNTFFNSFKQKLEVHNFYFYKNLYKKEHVFFNFNKKNKLLYKMHKKFFSRYYVNRHIFRHIFMKSACTHQFKITKFVEKFKTNSRINFFKQTQLFLFIVLISSQFFFFKKDCFFFLKNFGIFLNGKICTNAYKVLKIGDIIQIPVTKNFYIFFKNYKNYTFFFLKKYKLKFNKIFASRKKKYRTKSYLMPKWVERLSYYFEDIPKFLEVDFTILTIIIIYNNTTLHDTHSIIANNALLYLYRLYNWRRLN